jgi:hypothetical protein
MKIHTTLDVYLSTTTPDTPESNDDPDCHTVNAENNWTSLFIRSHSGKPWASFSRVMRWSRKSCQCGDPTIHLEFNRECISIT